MFIIEWKENNSKGKYFNYRKTLIKIQKEKKGLNCDKIANIPWI